MVRLVGPTYSTEFLFFMDPLSLAEQEQSSEDRLPADHLLCHDETLLLMKQRWVRIFLRVFQSFCLQLFPEHSSLS
jgi:hypothetical protein